MTCFKCNETLDASASFCPSCGAKVGASAATNPSGECESCGTLLAPGSSVCDACGKVNDAIGVGEKTKLTMNIGGKTKTFNLGDIGNLGVTLNTGDSSKALNLRALGKAANSAAERVKPGSGKKSKIVAIILAFFYGFPTWIYTYGKDKLKIWGSIAVSAVVGGVGGAVHLPGLVAIPLAGAWIWSIVLACSRPKEFYSEYGF